MYNIAIYIYLIGVAIGSLFNKKIKKMWRGEREAVDLLKEKVDPTAKYVWPPPLASLNKEGLLSNN